MTTNTSDNPLSGAGAQGYSEDSLTQNESTCKHPLDGAARTRKRGDMSMSSEREQNLWSRKYSTGVQSFHDYLMPSFGTSSASNYPWIGATASDVKTPWSSKRDNLPYTVDNDVGPEDSVSQQSSPPRSHTHSRRSHASSSSSRSIRSQRAKAISKEIELAAKVSVLKEKHDLERNANEHKCISTVH